MFTAKLIRHRHETQSILNGRINYIEHEDHFKVVFSHPEEFEKFHNWCIDFGGEYKFNRATNKQEGELPEKAKAMFKYEDVGWCDLITYYLIHFAGYSFHSVIADVSFKGEVYTKTIIDLSKPGLAERIKKIQDEALSVINKDFLIKETKP